MKGLNKVRKGIYSLGDFEVYPVEEFGIIVHPFYDLDGRKPIIYLKNLYGFLNTFTGPVLTLEEDCNINKTIGRFKRNCHTHNRFFVITKDYNPEPKEIGWDGIKTFISEFNPKRLKVAGGYYSKYEDIRGNSHRGGCLGTAIDNLNENFRNIEAIDNCIFSYW